MRNIRQNLWFAFLYNGSVSRLRLAFSILSLVCCSVRFCERGDGVEQCVSRPMHSD